MIRTLFLIFFVLGVAYQALSKDFGTQGHTYTILEPDLLQDIVGNLRTLEEAGKLEAHQKRILQKAKESLRRPPAVEGITRTTQAAIRYYDPSITVPYDLADHEGRLFQKAGAQINPLTHRSLTKPLLFIDGDDAAQVAWANSYKQAQVVLIKGSPFELMEAWERPVFFDQGGTLSKKLGIQHVPARVTQEGLTLKIEEIVLPEIQQ